MNMSRKQGAPRRGAVRVVLVSPEHDSNVGAVARAMKNFGCTQLVLVSPLAKIGFEATKFAKHSTDVLENAQKCDSLEKAVRGCHFVVGTTGVSDRFADRLKNLVSLPDLASKMHPEETIAIVFGRESTGLTQEELDACDVVCTIPTAPLHTVLNLSHAVAVVCYQLYVDGVLGQVSEEKKGGARPASRESRLVLERMFDELVAGLPSVRDPEKVANALKNMIERSRATEDEVRSLTAAMSPLHAARKMFRRL